jgi:lactam utilization protein B
MYLRGALDSAYFHHMRKITIYQIDAVGKLCRYQTRTLSYITAKRVMNQELRHQVKIHKISEELKLGINVCILLPSSHFFFKKIKAEKKHAS